MYPWFSIPDDVWESLAALARVRDEKTATASNTRYWTESPNMVGLCGEWVYSVLTGEPLNVTPEIWDDHVGCDFPGVDVKTSTDLRNPYLKSYGKLKAPFYFAAVLDVDGRMVKPLGFATRDMLASAEEHDYGYGHRTRRLRPIELLSADLLLARALRKFYPPSPEAR